MATGTYPAQAPGSSSRATLVFLSAVGALFLAGAVLVAGVVMTSERETSPSAGAALVPKAKLAAITAKEGVHWTHAPKVPPPVDRATPRRVVVGWTATESILDLDGPKGVKYAAWGFEGSVPGPILRVRVGDIIRFELTNSLSSQHAHNIDFHFATGPGGGAGALSVSPGETASVEVRALAPGFYMYHCATPDIPTHIANGMYGYVIVEPEGGLPEVDTELYVVQSEFYPTGDNPAKLDLARLDAEDPAYVVLNGAVGSLMGDNSPKVRVGDRVRIWYGNAGPQLISSFHVIGEIFDRVWREGDLVGAPGVGIQTTLVPAGGSTVVDFTIDVPGTYLLVDHAIARAIHKGAVGAIVVEGPQNYEVFEPGRKEVASEGDDHMAASSSVAITKGAWDPKNSSQAYNPQRIEVAAGATVAWKQEDEVAHTVTADDGKFDSGFLSAGKSYSFTFNEPGTFAYHCTPHPWMTGVVVVK